MSLLRKPNRQILTYIPRREPPSPIHLQPMEGYKHVYWSERKKAVAFVFNENSFLRSPEFDSPDAAQRWANQHQHELELR